MVAATTFDFLQRWIVLFCHLLFRSYFFGLLQFLSLQFPQLLSLLPATTTTTLFVQMPNNSTFRRLLKAESEAVLPENDDGLDELFASYQVRPDAIPQRGRRSAPSRDRLELAAAILWLHTHVNAAPAALDRLPYDMQVLLVECFVQDFSIFAGNSGWQTRLAGFFKFAAPPNSTPPARVAPGRARAGAGPSRRPHRIASVGSSPSPAGRRVDKGVPSGSTADDDSEIEGGDDDSPILSGGPDSPEREHASGGPGSTGSGERDRRRPSKKKKSSRRSKKKHRRTRSSSSSGGTSSSSSPSSSDSDEPAASSASPAAWALPAQLDTTPEVAALVTAACGRKPKWLRSKILIRGLAETDWLVRLFRGDHQNQKAQREYDRFLRDMQHEDRHSIFWIHRMALRYSKDDGYPLDARHLALLAVGESPADYAGQEGFRDQEGLRKYKEALAGLNEQWMFIRQAVDNGYDPGQSVYGSFRSQLLGMYARRYRLMHANLINNTTSAVKSVRWASREVLAHSARQCLEVQSYMTKFFDDVSSRAGAVGTGWTYKMRSEFVSLRVLSVFGDAVRAFVEVEGAAVRPLVPGAAVGAPAGTPQASSSSRSAAPSPLPWPTTSSFSSYLTPVGAGSASWGPPPPYAPPEALASFASPPGYAPPVVAAGAPSPYGGQLAPPPHPIDGAQRQVPGLAPGAQRAPKRGLNAALDGAQAAPFLGPGQASGSSPGLGGGRSPGDGTGGGGLFTFGGPASRADGSEPPPHKVRFDPVVKMEPHGGGGGQHSGGGGGGILAQPAHAWLLGKYAPHSGPAALPPGCACWKKFEAVHQGSIGAHARWDCPLRYIAQCGFCPGFSGNGLRLRGGWIDHDTPTDDTVADWKRLIEAKGLKPARGVHGAPRFPPP